MQVIVADGTQELLGLSEELSSLRPSSPMMSATWLARWWEFFGQAADAQLLALSVRDSDGCLVGFAPFFVNRMRAIEFLGSGRVCSDHLSILCREQREPTVTAAIVDWLFDKTGGRDYWQAIDLEAIDSDDLAMQLFVKRLRSRSDALVACRPDTGSWHLELPGSWDDYLQALTKNRRKRCRRWMRGYFESGRACFKVFDQEDELEAGFSVLEDLHNRRRRAIGEAGAFEHRPFRAFHRAVARELVSAGMLKLSCVELDGRSVAAEYLLVGDNTVYAYQSGIDPDALEDSPGNLSVMACIRSAIADGFQTFDFMRGDESYKANWGASPRTALRLRVWQRNVTGRLQQIVESARQSSKPVVSGLKSLMP